MPHQANMHSTATTNPVAIRRHGVEKGLGTGWMVAMQERLARAIKDAQIHRSGVQIDTAVKSVLLLIEAHVMVSLRWAWASEPASWLEGADLPENPTLGRPSHDVRARYTLGTGSPPIPTRP